ncbi:MAG: exosortase K [Bacteroidota bacterium]
MSNSPIGSLSFAQFLHFGAVIGVFVCLKLWASGATHAEVGFLTHPVSSFIGLITGSPGELLPNGAYDHARLGIVIEKSCSGSNFWLLCFGLLNLALFRFVSGISQSMGILALTLSSAYIITPLVNTSRIISYLFVQERIPDLPGMASGKLHLAMGAFIYLGALVTVYALTVYLTSKITHSYAQPPESQMDISG